MTTPATRLLRRARLTALAALLLAAAAPSVSAQRLATELVVDGLEHPVFLTAPPGDLDRLFVLEENLGRVRIIKNGVLLAAPFLDLGGSISFISERGLLGMAFHADYANNGTFFLSYTDLAGDSVVSRWSVSAADPDLADPASEVAVLTVPQPFGNHNGGMIAFGPFDRYLYVGLGDGGSGGDPLGNGQSGGTLLGKMLRLDVDSGAPYRIPPDNPFVGPGDPLDEIWALGLRNPWRFDFDPDTGDLWIGDVGQNGWEEIDWQPGSSPGGENYGWKIMEGSECYDPPSGCNTAGLTLPIHDYAYEPFLSRICVIGGAVYRGAEIPGLGGSYFFADWGSHEVWTLRERAGQAFQLKGRTAELVPGGGRDLERIASFGRGGDGELYAIDRNDGEVFRIVGDLMDLAVPALVAGQSATVTVSGASPGALVLLGYSLTGPGVTPVEALDGALGLADPRLLASSVADASGAATFTQAPPAGSAGRTVWLQAAEVGNTSAVVQATIG